MLQSIFIQNFALLSEVKLDFQAGYTVITGETGSGKSILLNALNLILGERADFKVIGPKSDKAIVEAEFQIDLKRFASFFELNDLDGNEITIVRREISSQGRSRAFINDIPVQLNTLKEFSQQLVSIHSQYNTLDLKSKDYQLDTLDVLLGLENKKSDFQRSYSELKSTQSEYNQLNSKLADALKESDYNAFQCSELETLQLSTLNYESIENELNRIQNSDEIKFVFARIQQDLGAENGIVDRLVELKSIVQKSVKLDVSFSELEQRLNAVIIELKDMDEAATDQLMEIDADPARKLELEKQLDDYNRVLTKHKLSDQNALLELFQELSKSLLSTDEMTKQLNGLTSRIEKLEKETNEKAQALHALRLSEGPKVEKKLKDLLGSLKLPDTELEFKLTATDQLNAQGNSKIELLFSANKGVPTVPIENAASGGELSRVMLALQKMISEKQHMPTVFFDEIDTGVSGDVAQKIGTLLHAMGENMQLIAISHLPQVAAKARNHFKVLKQLQGDYTQTQIISLSANERVEEIARLMSGEQITDAAISNAKALMN